MFLNVRICCSFWWQLEIFHQPKPLKKQGLLWNLAKSCLISRSTRNSPECFASDPTLCWELEIWRGTVPDTVDVTVSFYEPSAQQRLCFLCQKGLCLIDISLFATCIVHHLKQSWDTGPSKKRIERKRLEFSSHILLIHVKGLLSMRLFNCLDLWDLSSWHFSSEMISLWDRTSHVCSAPDGGQ